MNYKDRISIDPRIRSGKPCIRGTQIAVADVFDYLSGGMSFAFAADRERRLSLIPYEAAV